MEKLRKENLEAIVRQIIADFSGKIYDDFKIYGLAIAILRHYFGNEWTEQNASAFFEQKVPKKNRKGRIFFRTEDPVAENQFRHQLRITQLAEMIFNLQDIDGVDERIEKIKQGALETFYGELECAAQIKKANLPFCFVTPSGNKGGDFDVEILLSSGIKLNCEMKVTTEEKDLKQSTILNKLSKAKDQLPKEQPCVIFLKVPESWHKQTNVQVVLNESFSEFLRSTDRVVALVLRWEELTVDINSLRPAILNTSFRVEPNKKSIFYNSEIENALLQMYKPSEQNWTHFRDIVKSVKDEDVRLE